MVRLIDVMSTRSRGGTSSRRMLHHCCGYAFRRFEKLRPTDALETKPVISTLAKALRRLDDQCKAPGTKWPKWRGRLDFHSQGIGSWPIAVKDAQVEGSSKDENVELDTLQADIISTRMQEAENNEDLTLASSPPRRALKIGISDASTALLEQCLSYI